MRGELCCLCGQKLYDGPHDCPALPERFRQSDDQEYEHPEECRHLAGVVADALTANEVEP